MTLILSLCHEQVKTSSEPPKKTGFILRFSSYGPGFSTVQRFRESATKFGSSGLLVVLAKNLDVILDSTLLFHPRFNLLTDLFFCIIKPHLKTSHISQLSSILGYFSQSPYHLFLRCLQQLLYCCPSFYSCPLILKPEIRTMWLKIVQIISFLSKNPSTCFPSHRVKSNLYGASMTLIPPPPLAAL